MEICTLPCLLSGTIGVPASDRGDPLNRAPTQFQALTFSSLYVIKEMPKAESGKSKYSGEVTESRIEVRVRHQREY